MNQDSDGSTYGTAAKDQTSQKQEAGDSKPENEDDLRTTLIGARPVASGGFSTSSVSEEFFKELKNIEKSFVQSGGQKNMLEDDAKDIGGDKAAEVAPGNGEKGGKEESNRLLKFQISAPPAAAAKSRCTAGHGHCGCRRKPCRNKRAAGRVHADGRCNSKSRSSSCHRRRHSSASSAARQSRGGARSEAHKHPQEAPIAHRRQRHHHYRHQRRMRDGDFSDGCVQTPPTAPQKPRHCCRSAAASDCCCFRAPTKRASGGDDHQVARPDENGDQRENGAKQTRRKSGRRGDTLGDSGATKRGDKTKCGNVFSRYRTNYRSAETGSSTSSSSSLEDDCGEQVAIASCKHESDGSRTFNFTQTRGSSSPARHGQEVHSSRTRSRSNSQRRCIDGPVESTVEKHVLELNFPASPLMRSISNLLKLHCPCEDNVEDKEVEDDNEDDDDEEKNDANAERFVHRMRLGQTCELQGDSQVVLVSLPEPHKLTVEHVIRSSSCLVQEERCKSRHLDDSKQVCAERDREKRPIDKKGARCEGTIPDVPRIRRKHSYVRHTRRLKVPHVRQDILAPSKALHPCSSSSSDSSEDDDANDVTYSKEKGAEEVVVRPAVAKSSWRSRAAGREEIAGGGLQQATGAAADHTQGQIQRLRQWHWTEEASSADSALEETPGDRGGDEGADNTVRIVFTDSRLNTELRCILQQGSSASQEERQGSSRALPARKKGSGGSCERPTRRPHQVDVTRKADEDSTAADADSVREGAIRRQQCGCVSSTQRRPPRRIAEDSDVVSSSYYSSTHESSVALNEATKAGSGCTLCRTIRAMSAKERPWRRHWQRCKHSR
ncbi:hypothetical protein MRX96_055170 [Rhipicephalus microplus]